MKIIITEQDYTWGALGGLPHPVTRAIERTVHEVAPKTTVLLRRWSGRVWAGAYGVGIPFYFDLPDGIRELHDTSLVVPVTYHKNIEFNIPRLEVNLF